MHLTIIAKAPVPGRVKTRLCPPCTPAQAAAVAAAALADTVDAVDELVARRAGGGALRRVLLLDGDADSWAPAGYDVVAQRGAGLAARLANGFADLGPGVVVAMDTPGAVPWLAAALDALGADVDVIGLATDGGFWALGLTRTDPAVFVGVPMSASHTGVAQLRRLHALGRSVRLLPVARDLDTPADLAAAAAGSGSGRLATVARSIVGVQS